MGITRGIFRGEDARMRSSYVLAGLGVEEAGFFSKYGNWADRQFWLWKIDGGGAFCERGSAVGGFGSGGF